MSRKQFGKSTINIVDFSLAGKRKRAGPERGMTSTLQPRRPTKANTLKRQVAYTLLGEALMTRLHNDGSQPADGQYEKRLAAQQER